MRSYAFLINIRCFETEQKLDFETEMMSVFIVQVAKHPSDLLWVEIEVLINEQCLSVKL